jgi:hypothetical protein
MTKREREDKNRMLDAMYKLGFSSEEATTLRRISMTLRRWFELECGTQNEHGTSFAIEHGAMVDDSFSSNPDGKPFLRIAYHKAKNYRVDHHAIADKEKGARKRLADILTRHPTIDAYIQTDCRGCALYLYKKAALHKYMGQFNASHIALGYGHIDRCYTSIALAVY